MGVNIVMNPGEGPNSYAQSSKYQGSSVDAVKSIIVEEINKNLDVNTLSLINTSCFTIADFGCSTGHNSFRIMEIITDAIAEKFKTQGTGSKIPDFQVFFNDQVMNDFNTLFKSLPTQGRRYYTAGVPGSFHGRLFPKSSIHFAHSCWSLHWLSKVPKAIMDPTSPACNDGRSHYIDAPKEVYDAYLDQFSMDIDLFLEVRAEEVVDGGIMALLIPGIPDVWNPETSYVMPSGIPVLDSCLMEIVKEGRVDGKSLGSINIPLYMPTPKEMISIIRRSRNFSLERIEALDNPGSRLGWRNPKEITAFYRSTSEAMLQHLGPEIVDELFLRFEKRLETLPIFAPENDKTILILVILKKNIE